MRSPLTPARLLVAATLLPAVTALGLALDNPEVPSRDRASGGYDVGPSYQCDAPYDTVLNGSRNVPGGEPTGSDRAVAADCRAAGTTRFVLASGAGLLSAAGLLGAVGVPAAARHRRRAVSARPAAVDA